MTFLHKSSVQQVDRLDGSKYGMIKPARRELSFEKLGLYGVCDEPLAMLAYRKHTHEKSKTSIRSYKDA